MADLPVCRGSLTTLPRNAGLAPAPALRRAPAGGRGPSPSPFLHLQSLFIYLCKLKEPEPATGRGLWSQKKPGVWAQRLPPTQGKETLPRKGGGDPLKSHRAGKGTTQARGTKEGGGHQRDHFGGPTEDGERGLASGVPQPPAACVSTQRCY